ncbi:cation:proton antiporter [Actinoplanes sp. NPDC024001]|uniref:cation:proton antiporter domain-containing protein n=1 Tax=Actinoplanes sp. NPDC024001 TaxID=3154598 RepID=UPI0033E773A1
MTAHQVGQLLLGLAVVIVLARVLGAAAKRIGQPPVVGEILAGILIGPTLFGHLISDRLFPAEILPALAGLANVGLVLFMFIVGYELDDRLVRGRQRVAVSISVGSVLAPLAFGVLLALWLAGRHDVTDVLPFALFIGAAMAVTAFPVLARIVADRGLMRTEVGGLALASAAVDDVLAWSLLAVVVAVGAADGGAPWQLIFAVPYLAAMFLLVRPLLRRLLAARDRAGRLTPDVLAVILVGLLLSCYATEQIGLHAIFGAFVFGAVMPRVGGDTLRHEILERLEQVSVLLLLPMFFVIAGLQVDLSTIDLSALTELALILLTAIGGKFAGAYAGARLNRIGNRQAGAIATLMNTRGLTEIVILTVGLQLGILDGQLFSMMVVMALVTTAMAGPLLAWIYPRRLAEADIARAERALVADAAGFRVLAVVPPGAAAAGLVDLAADLAGPARPATVALARLVPYATSPLEVGSGHSANLVAMNTTMAELAALARPLVARGLAAPVVTRFSAGPAADLAELVRSGEPDVVVLTEPVAMPEDVTVGQVTVSAPPERFDTVLARVAVAADAPSVLRVAVALALARQVPLVIEAGTRPPRAVTAAVRELARRGVPAGLGAAPDGVTLIVADSASERAHVIVRAGWERSEPARWIERLLVPGTAVTTVEAT